MELNYFNQGDQIKKDMYLENSKNFDSIFWVKNEFAIFKREKEKRKIITCLKLS